MDPAQALLQREIKPADSTVVDAEGFARLRIDISLSNAPAWLPIQGNYAYQTPYQVSVELQQEFCK